MLTATVAGNVAKDAIVRDAGKDRVCSFSVAHNDPADRDAPPTWVDVSIWGTRGEKLAEYIRKGDKIAVSGQLSTRLHEGKTYLQIRGDSVELCGSGGAGRREEARDGEREESRRDDRRDDRREDTRASRDKRPADDYPKNWD